MWIVPHFIIPPRPRPHPPSCLLVTFLSRTAACRRILVPPSGRAYGVVAVVAVRGAVRVVDVRPPPRQRHPPPGTATATTTGRRDCMIAIAVVGCTTGLRCCYLTPVLCPCRRMASCIMLFVVGCENYEDILHWLAAWRTTTPQRHIHHTYLQQGSDGKDGQLCTLCSSYCDRYGNISQNDPSYYLALFPFVRHSRSIRSSSSPNTSLSS